MKGFDLPFSLFQLLLHVEVSDFKSAILTGKFLWKNIGRTHSRMAKYLCIVYSFENVGIIVSLQSHVPHFAVRGGG